MYILVTLFVLFLLQEVTIAETDEDISEEEDKGQGPDPCKNPKINAILRRTIEPTTNLLFFNDDVMWEFDFKRKKLGTPYKVLEFWPELKTPINDVTLLRPESRNPLWINRSHVVFIKDRDVWLYDYEYEHFDILLDWGIYNKTGSDIFKKFLARVHPSDKVVGITFDEHMEDGKLRTRVHECKNIGQLSYCYFGTNEPCHHVPLMTKKKSLNCAALEIYRGNRENVEAVMISTDDSLKTYFSGDGLEETESYSVRELYGCGYRYWVFILIGGLVVGCLLLVIGITFAIVVVKRRKGLELREVQSTTTATFSGDRKVKKHIPKSGKCSPSRVNG